MDPLEGLPFPVEPLTMPVEDGISIQGTAPLSRPSKNGRIYSPAAVRKAVEDMLRPKIHPTEEFAAKLFPEEGGQGVLERKVDNHLYDEVGKALREGLKHLPRAQIVGKPVLDPEKGTLTINVSIPKPVRHVKFDLELPPHE